MKGNEINSIIQARFRQFKEMVFSTVYNSEKKDARETLTTVMNDLEVELSLAEAKKQLALKQLNYVKHLLSQLD
jgi:hypothetical protein